MTVRPALGPLFWLWINPRLALDRSRHSIQEVTVIDVLHCTTVIVHGLHVEPKTAQEGSRIIYLNRAQSLGLYYD